ncbi:ATP-binding cassette, subfamily B, MsbA [Nitrosomonas cryotolerans]|uniref:ATP-binding cassette, subfamily B, MsbA n=1 Tax=Nitrosomonas cryotolerans ATCC 49181 TaxID=1131553 RepID=A0A1N6I758_9PROT|nr:ABC transporter transmembrane domain-containing protein [Nitrosomonas cryotolerans]SFQ14251.1 ATP-binding cassette, subfamily B, MsbA [Nitrosomonas cryotolerans]SIO27861.1 ATP-binding cassette, subfamily B, MsbA [Nitrosomonas cryotolerans ATCC 49181]
MIITQYYCRLLKWITPYWKTLSIAILFLAIMALTLSMLPAFIKQILNSIFVNKDPESIQFVALAIIMLFIIYGTASYISIHAINAASNKLGIDLRIAMFHKLLNMPVQYHDNLTRCNLATRFIVDIDQITHTISNVIIILVKDSLTLIGLTAWMFYLNWELSLLGLLIAPIIVLSIQLFDRLIHKTNQQARQISEALTQGLLNTIDNYKTIKLYGGLWREKQHFRRQAEQVYQATMHQVVIKALGISLGQAILILILTAIVYLMTQQAYYNKIIMEDVGSFIVAILIFILPVQRISSIYQHLQQGQRAIENLFSFLTYESKPDTGTMVIEAAQGELTFERVSFSFHSQAESVLDNLSFVIKPGEVVAFIVPNCSDKTIFMDLILRFLCPTGGRILLDGHDVANLKLTNLHANIAMISQNQGLLDKTIAANIAYGTMRCASEAKITAASQASHAMDFIREMPQGLQTHVGEGEIELTEQQCQYLAIARVFLKNPPILILEDVPMTINSESQHLQATLESLMQGRTTLIITQQHCLSEKIDRIFVLENGKITETRKWNKLFTKQGNCIKFFQSLFKANRDGQSSKNTHK